jgi:hypothetical protein
MIYILVNHTGEESHFYNLCVAYATNKTGMFNVNQRCPFIEKNPLMMGKYIRKTVRVKEYNRRQH